MYIIFFHLIKINEFNLQIIQNKKVLFKNHDVQYEP